MIHVLDQHNKFPLFQFVSRGADNYIPKLYSMLQ